MSAEVSDCFTRFFEHRVQQVILFLIPMHNLKEVIINVSLTVFFICMYKM